MHADACSYGPLPHESMKDVTEKEKKHRRTPGDRQGEENGLTYITWGATSHSHRRTTKRRCKTEVNQLQTCRVVRSLQDQVFCLKEKSVEAKKQEGCHNGSYTIVLLFEKKDARTPVAPCEVLALFVLRSFYPHDLCRWGGPAY